MIAQQRSRLRRSLKPLYGVAQAQSA